MITIKFYLKINDIDNTYKEESITGDEFCHIFFSVNYDKLKLI